MPRLTFDVPDGPYCKEDDYSEGCPYIDGRCAPKCYIFGAALETPNEDKRILKCPRCSEECWHAKNAPKNGKK